ncbi:hypothetical protein NEIG_01431 [Nematocida sp. ERTm5]|nr:hypothetical protein NEIG_01431 [Nematocida sp. ERTm5]
MGDINIKTSSFGAYKDVEKQIKSQGVMKFKKEEETTAMYFARMGSNTLFGIMVILMFVGWISILLQMGIPAFTLAGLSKTACLLIVDLILSFGWVITMASSVLGISKGIEYLYSLDTHLFSTVSASVLIACGSVGWATLIMRACSGIFGIWFNDYYMCVWTLTSLSTFICTVGIVLNYYSRFFFTANANDIDKPLFDIKSDEPVPDLKIDILDQNTNAPNNIYLVGEKPSDQILNVTEGTAIPTASQALEKGRATFQEESNKIITGQKNIKKYFTDYIIYWALIIGFPFIFLPLLAGTFSFTSGIHWITLMSTWFNSTTKINQVFFFLIIGTLNWIFSVFVRVVSLICGSCIGVYRYSENSKFTDVYNKISTIGSKFIFTSFKETLLVTSVNTVFSLCFLLSSLGKLISGSSNGISIALYMLILSISIIMTFFSSIVSLFSAFKYVKLGMYPSSLAEYANMSSLDTDWKSYLTMCMILCLTVVFLLLVFGSAFSALGINPYRIFITNTGPTSMLKTISSKVYLIIGYSILMLLFVIIPSIFEIVKSRPGLAKDLVINKVLLK